MSPDEVNVGLVIPDSGTSAAYLAAARSGVNARLGTVNAAGGVYGRQVVYDWRDDRSDPDANLFAAQDLVERADVFGILELSLASGGSAEYLNTQRVPVVGQALGDEWGAFLNMFSVSSFVSGDSVYDNLGVFAHEVGATRAVVVSAQSVPAAWEGAEKAVRSLLGDGVEVAGLLNIDTLAASPERIGQQIADAGADVLIVLLDVSGFALVYQEALGAGARLKVALSPVGYGQDALAVPGLAGAYFATSYLPFEADVTAFDDYRGAVANYAPELQPPDQEMAVSAYIAADLLVRGLEEAGPCPTREAFIRNLRAVTDFDGAGLLPGPIDMTASFGEAIPCFGVVRVNSTATAFEVGNPDRVCGDRVDLPEMSPPTPFLVLPTG